MSGTVPGTCDVNMSTEINISITKELILWWQKQTTNKTSEKSEGKIYTHIVEEVVSPVVSREGRKGT